MNFNGDFNKIGELDITSLRKAVEAITDEEWGADAWRQKEFDTHADTETIQLVFDADFRHSNPTYLPKYDELKSLVEPVTQLIARHFNKSLSARRLQKKHGKGYLVRMILVRLKPGGVIPPHGDEGHSLLHGHRIHVPIISQGKALFTVGDTTKALLEGEVWEINNKRTHSVHNTGDTPRIHLICDWAIPGERCCCGKKLRPQGVCSPEACHSTDFGPEECNCYPH